MFAGLWHALAYRKIVKSQITARSFRMNFFRVRQKFYDCKFLTETLQAIYDSKQFMQCANAIVPVVRTTRYCASDLMLDTFE